MIDYRRILRALAAAGAMVAARRWASEADLADIHGLLSTSASARDWNVCAFETRFSF